MTMYSRGHDTRLGGEDSPAELSAKRLIVEALDRLKTHPARDTDRLWAEVEANEAILAAESSRKIQDHKRRFRERSV
jgi:hypothetical protein